jgi:hypothetical protein
VPSPDYNRLAFHVVSGNREILQFRGDPHRDGSYAQFRVPPLQIGPRLLAIIDSLDEVIPRHLAGRGDGLMLAAHRTR